MLSKATARSVYHHSKLLQLLCRDDVIHSVNNDTFQQVRAPFIKRFSQKLITQSNPITMPVEIPKIVFVLGGPGAGKGTQCEKIVKRFDFVHLSAGDLLREERSREGSEYGELIEEYIRNGKIVPVEVTCSLLEKAMKNSGKNKFLIDGFPRNQDNLQGWARQMTGKADLQFVLFFNCDESVCIDRCLNRGKGGSGRSDDNMESLHKRIKTYKFDSVPIIEYFENLGQVKKIDASRSEIEVFNIVEKVFCDSGFE